MTGFFAYLESFLNCLYIHSVSLGDLLALFGVMDCRVVDGR